MAFPISAATGAAATAVVSFEVAPGGRQGRHTDSAEEAILVLAGEAEAEVDGERGRRGPDGLALIPAMAPHDVRNVGAGPLRAVGFFAVGQLAGQGRAGGAGLARPAVPPPRGPGSNSSVG